jgi:hypothetical protein
MMRSAWDSADCDPIADIHSAIDAIKQSCGEQPPWPKARDDLGEALSTRFVVHVTDPHGTTLWATRYARGFLFENDGAEPISLQLFGIDGTVSAHGKLVVRMPQEGGGDAA